MHNLNLTDETFDVNQSNHYFLSMQSSLNGFSYAISDTVRNKCIHLKHHAATCSQWDEYKSFVHPVIETDEYLQLSFKGIHHVICHPQFTIMPEPFVPGNEEQINTFFSGIPESNSSLTSSSSVISKSRILCPYPRDLSFILQKKFTGIKLSHHTLPFVYNLVNDSTRSLRHIFHMLVQKEFVTIGVAHSSGLDFINTFPTKTMEDVLYYVLLVLEKFKAPASMAEVYVMNETGQKDLNMSLQAYIGKVRPMKAPQNIVYSYVLSEEIMERFANLLNVYHCE